MVFETLSAILLGFPFFDKNEIIIDAHNILLQTPETNFQLNFMHIKGSNKQERPNSRKKIMVKTKTTLTLSTGEQKIFGTILIRGIWCTRTNWTSRACTQILKTRLWSNEHAWQTYKEPKYYPTCNQYNRSSTSQWTRFSSSNIRNCHTRASSLLDTTWAKIFPIKRFLKKTIKQIEKSIGKTAKGEKSHNNKRQKRILVPDPRNQSRHIQDERSRKTHIWGISQIQKFCSTSTSLEKRRQENFS